MCPKCSSKDVLLAPQITDQISDEPFGLAQDAYVCGACGFIEFYARDVEALRARSGLVKQVGGGGAPFR